MSILYVLSGNLDKGHDLAFKLLDALILRHGEENITKQIEYLVNTINPFNEDLTLHNAPISSANLISFKNMLAQAYRIAARLLCANGNYSAAKEYFELSLSYNPNYILTKYEYAVLLSKDIQTRAKSVELLTAIGSSHDDLQAYRYYGREYTKVLPKLMLGCKWHCQSNN